MTRWKMVPSYSGTPCFFWCVTGLIQSFLPSDRSTKFCTPMGALSGNNWQFNLPAVVSTLADMSAGDFAAGDFEGRLAGVVDLVCAHRGKATRHNKIAINLSLLMKAPE